MNIIDLIQKLRLNSEFQEKLNGYAISLNDFDENKWIEVQNNLKINIFENIGYNNVDEKVILFYVEDNIEESIGLIFDRIKELILKEKMVMCLIITENRFFDVEIGFINTKQS